MEIKYYLQDLSAGDARRDEEAILRFPSIVKAFAPEVEGRVTWLNSEQMPDVHETIIHSGKYFGSPLSIICSLLTKGFESNQRLVICCEQNSELAVIAKEEADHAQWGVHCDNVAIVYHHQPSVPWHEMLRLLGTEDCYEDGGAKDKICGHDNCVMQYAPTVAAVGDPPFLCEENVQRIGDTCEQCRKLNAADNGA